ncbi:MAG: hypothetical protein Q9216_005425 [Gyalolechia sp. 2 TL-2023]
MAPPRSNLLLAVLAIAVCLQPNASAMPVEHDKRQVAGVPPYVLSYAPKVWLQSEDPYFPSDIGAQLLHTKPEVDFNVVDGAPNPLTLENLSSLNALGGRSIYLTSVDDITTNPPWLDGVKPDGNGKTNGATSCVVVVNDRGSGYVDAFYFYFYAFNEGNTVFGQDIGDHVGDWEHNMIRFKNGIPQAIWYSQHSYGEAFTYSSVEKQGSRPIAYSAKGSHASYATTGTHDHTIPGLNLPAGPIEDYCDQGTLWDPLANAYFYSYAAATNTFKAYDGTSPTDWLQYLGQWGDQQYPNSDKRQKKIFNIAVTAKYTSGPTGPVDKYLNRADVCPPRDNTPCFSHVLPRLLLENHTRKMAEEFNDIEDLRHRNKPVGIRSESNDGDAELAARFGYQPVFKREFGYLATFSFAFSISGLFSTVATTFSYSLYAGGASSAVWAWLISGAGCMAIACSVAELVSAYPTCGGLYYTVSKLAPKKWVPSISWITGWLNLLGQIAGVASSEYGAAQLLLAAVSMGSGFTYLPTTGTTIGVMAGLSVLTGMVNSLSTYWMEKMTKTYVLFHVIALVTCCIALLAQSDNRHTASYVFTDVNSTSGWSPVGFAWLFGFLPVSWTMTDYDATAHITEEISNPGKKAPWAISMAMLFTWLAGFGFNIVLCFVMGDATSILESPMGQPVAQIFYNVLGKGGGVLYAVCAVFIIKFVTFTAMQSLGRTVFALSRDRLVPFSSTWVKINPVTQTPIYAVWISVFWVIAINLIGLGSHTAIAGVFNVTAIALDVSYCVPIVCKLAFGQFERGPWHMGRFSFFVNGYACTWTFFATIIFILPTVRPVAPDTTNYAIAFLGAILIFAAFFWLVSGRRFYTGPLIEAPLDENESTGSRDNSEPSGVVQRDK